MTDKYNFRKKNIQVKKQIRKMWVCFCIYKNNYRTNMVKFLKKYEFYIQ